MKISKIVITGGPCAGKSTAMSWVQNAFTQIGYTVLFVPETATELITGGVAPWTCGTNAEYQKCQLKLQIEKENIFEQAARTKKIVYCYNECGCSSDVLCFTPVHSKYAAYLYSTLYTDILLTSHTLKIGAESIHLLLRFLFCQQVPYLTLSKVVFGHLGNECRNINTDSTCGYARLVFAAQAAVGFVHSHLGGIAKDYLVKVAGAHTGFLCWHGRFVQLHIRHGSLPSFGKDCMQLRGHELQNCHTCYCVRLPRQNRHYPQFCVNLLRSVK